MKMMLLRVFVAVFVAAFDCVSATIASAPLLA